MKRFLILTVLSFLSCVSSYGQFDKMAINDLKIESISLSGSTSVNGGVSLIVTSPVDSFSVSDVSVIIYCKGKKLVTGTARPFSIKPGRNVYNLSGNLKLDSGMSVFSLLSNLSMYPSNYTLDIDATIGYSGGKKRQASRKGLPASALLSGKR